MQRRKFYRKKKKTRKSKQKRMKKPVDIAKRPSWNSCSNDMSQYKLSRTEYVHFEPFHFEFPNHLLAAEKGHKSVKEQTKSQGGMAKKAGEALNGHHGRRDQADLQVCEAAWEKTSREQLLKKL